MINAVQLHHFGEDLVKKIIESLGPVGFNKFIEKGIKNKTIIHPRNIKLSMNKFSRVEIGNKFEVKRNDSKKVPHWHYDGGHKVDVTIFYDDNACLPIEVKMGRDGISKSWKDFESKIKKVERKTKENGLSNTLKGSVPSFLCNNITKELRSKIGEIKIISQIEKQKKASFSSWGLVIRKSQFEKFKIMNTDSTIVLPFVFTIEDLVKFYEKFKIQKIEVIIVQVLNESKIEILKELNGSSKIIV